MGAAGGSGRGSDVLPAVRAQDVVPLREEASPHQRQRALLAVKAVVVPLPLLEGDVLSAAQSCGRRKTTRVRMGGGRGESCVDAFQAQLVRCDQCWAPRLNPILCSGRGAPESQEKERQTGSTAT